MFSDFKIEIEMQPDQDMPNRPYRWRLLRQGKDKAWEDIGRGYAKSPAAAFCKAQSAYETFITPSKTTCTSCLGTGYVQIAPNIRGIKRCPDCDGKGVLVL